MKALWHVVLSAAFATLVLGLPGDVAHAGEDVKSLLGKLEKAGRRERPRIIVALREAKGEAVAVLGKQLASADASSQMKAAALLGELKLPDGVGPLVKALQSPHYGVRVAVAKALGALGQKEAVPALCKALTDRFYAVRLDAVSALGLLRDPSAIDVLKGVLLKDHQDASGVPARTVAYDSRSTYTRDHLPDIWLIACDALAKIGEPALPVLRQRLSAKQPEIRAKVAYLLLGLKDGKSLPAIIQSMQSGSIAPTPDLYTRLGRMQSPSTVPVLVQALDAPDSKTREAAAVALGQTGDRAVVPIILARYRSGQLELGALTALAALADLSTESVFIEAIGSGDGRAQAIAIGALGKIGSTRSLPGLLSLSIDKNTRIAIPARRAVTAILSRLAQAGDRSALESALTALDVPDRGLRTAACGAVGRLGDAAQTNVLANLLAEKDVLVRRAAAQALEAMATRVRVPLPHLMKALSDRDRVVSGACYHAAQLSVRDLSVDEKDKLLPELKELAESKSALIRRLAAFGLGEVGGERSGPSLLRLAADKDRSVAAEAIKALRLGTGLEYGNDLARWQAWWRLRESPAVSAQAVPFEETELSFVPAASLRLPFGSPQAVALDGRYAYLANGEGGLVVVDVRKEKEPAVVAQIATGGNSQFSIVDHWWGRKIFQKAFAVAVSEDEAFLATHSNGYDVNDVYVYRIDVKDPVQPRVVDKQWARGGVPTVMHVRGTRVFLLGGGVLTILDFQERGRPAKPIQWSEQKGRKVIKGVGLAVTDSVAFVVNEQGKLTVLELKDPPVALATLQIAKEASGLCMLGERVFVGSGSEISVLDASEPAQPSVVSKLTLPDEKIVELAAFEKRVFARTGSSRIYEIEAEKLDKPRVKRLFERPLTAFAIRKRMCYVSDPTHGLTILDMRKPNRALGRTQTAGELKACARLSDGRIACALGPGGLAVVPSTLDAAPRWYLSPADGDILAVFAAKGKLYASTNSGLVILSDAGEKLGVFKPSAGIPELRPGPSEDAAALDRIAWTHVEGDRAHLLNAPAGLMIVDVADPRSPRFLGRYDTEVNVHNHVHGDNFPTWSNERNTPQSVTVAGDRAYVAMGRSGLYVLDVADPKAPKFLGGFFDRATGKMSAWRVALEGNRVYLSDLDNGLYVLDASDPAALKLIDHFHTANAHGFALSEQLILVADGGYGLRAIKRTEPLAYAGAYHAQRIWFREVMWDGGELLVGDRAGLLRFRVEESVRTSRTAFQLESPICKEDGKPLSPEEVVNTYGTVYRVEAAGVDVSSSEYQGHAGCENRLIPVCQDLSDEAGFPRVAVQSQTVAVDPARGRIKFSDGDRDPIRRLGKLHLTMGIPHRLAVHEKLLFTINEEGLNLRCYDISDPLKPRMRSAIATGGFACHGLTVKWPYVGASNNQSAFTVYDFSDPDHPVHTSFVGPCRARGMEFDDGDRLYCVNWRTMIVDVKDITKPKVLGEIPNCHASRFCARGDFLYTPTKEGLAIYNVRDPKNPVKAAVHPGGWAEPIVCDGMLYVVGKTFDILDVKNPAAPRKLSSTPLSGRHLAIERGFAYVAHGHTLHVVDVSKPEAPKVLSSLSGMPNKYGLPKGDASSVGVSDTGEHVFVGLKWYGFVVIDMRDKLRPRLVSGVNDSAGDYTGIRVDDGRAYIGMNWGALYIADVSDAAKPTLIGDTRRLIDGATGPHVRNKTVYFSGFENNPSLRIVDASVPASPKLLSQWRVPASWYDRRRGGGSFSHRLGKYLVTPWACATLDVSEPTRPRLVGTLPDREPYSQKVIARGNYAYLASYKGKKEHLGLRVVSLHDPKRPTVVGQLHASCSGGYYFGHGVYLRGDYLYGVSFGPFFIVDVSDPTKPTLVSVTELRGFGSDCYVNYPYAYVTMYYGGLNVLDISDPANPVLIDWVGYGGYQDEAGWDNLGCYQSIATYRGAAFITEYYTGLMTFDVPTPSQAPSGTVTVRMPPAAQ